MKEQALTCIGCGSTEHESWWIRIDHANNKGLCSDCAELAKAWDQGERGLRVTADRKINQALPIPDTITIER